MNTVNKSLTFGEIEDEQQFEFEIKRGGNTMTLHLPPVRRLRIADFEGRHLPGIPYHLKLSGGEVVSGKTDAEGWTRNFDPIPVDSARLTTGDQAYDLEFSGKDAHVGVAEAQSLLNAAGFEAGPLDGELGSQTRAALVAFQRVARLAVSGKPDADTLNALKDRLEARSHAV